MARGWESKSVEDQIDMAAARRAQRSENHPQPADLDAVRKRESLLLSRTRVVRELETAQNQRYKTVLNKALTDLDAQLKLLRDVE